MDEYATFLRTARADPRVVGVVLTGSRGHGARVREWSDWDVRVVVRDDVSRDDRAQLELPFPRLARIVADGDILDQQRLFP